MKKLLFFLFIGMSLCSLGQTSNPQWVNYYSKTDVTCIVPDGNTLWLGSYVGGVYQSDLSGNVLHGYSIENGLPSKDIISIAIDAQGNKWFGTGFGVIKFDGTNWTTYTMANGLVYFDVRSIAIDAQGNKWFGTDGGVSRFDGTNWTSYTTANGLIDNPVTSIAIDAQGNKWFGTGYGVSKFDGTNWTSYTTANGLVGNDVRSIAIDIEGNKWFGTSDGVSKFDGTNWTSYTTANGLVDNSVSSIATDAQGNKWFGTNSGVSKFDGTNWTSYTSANSLIENPVTSIAIDAQGNKWFGARYSGVSKFDGTNWTAYTSANGIAGITITSITIDSHENKWFGIGGGVSTFDGKSWTSYTTANGLTSSNVISMAIDAQGNKWVGTYAAGVSKFDGTNWTTYTTANGLINNDVWSIASDAQGNKWFGTNAGVSKFDGTNWISYTKANGLAANSVSSIAIDAQGNKWFGTRGCGVSKFDGTSWTTYTTANGLVDDLIQSITIDAQGNKWFGTYRGVSKFDGTSWTTYTTANGLVDNDIKSIAIDKKGNKWFCTNNGVSKYDSTTWTTYTTANGLANNEVLSIAIDAQGNKWFGTLWGITVFNEYGVTFANTIVKDTVAHLSGSLFYDADKNLAYSTNEYYLKNQKVLLLPDSISTFTNNNGEYAFKVDSGKTYSIQILPQAPYFKRSQALSFQVKVSKKDSILPAVGLLGKDTVSFRSNFTMGIHRCGRDVPFYFTFQNTGTHSANAVIAIAIDKRVTFLNAIPSVDSVGVDGRLIWKSNNIAVSDDRQVQIQASLPSGTLDTLFYNAELLYNGKVATSASLVLPTRCSYDPNDKQVNPIGINKEKLTLKGQNLQYTIRFQNTGNDYAYDVKIVDTLSASLNWSTLVVAASSHKVRTEITAKGIVTFFFDNIMLPDSGTNYMASNGFVCYTIQPKSNVTDNSKIENTAHIIFDQNPAVVTNTTLNTLVSSFPFPVSGDIDGNGIINGTEIAGDTNKNGTIDGNEILGDLDGDGIINNGELLGDANGNGLLDNNESFKQFVSNPIVKSNNYSVFIYPNPVTDKLTIKLNEGKIPTSIQIINVLGQIVYSKTITTDQPISINMSDNHSGIYFVIVEIDGMRFSKMVIKK